MAPTPNDEANAVEQAYLDKIKELYSFLVTNMTTGNTDDAAVRFERGVEMARAGRVAALQVLDQINRSADGYAEA